MYTYPRETDSRDPVKPVTHRRSGRQKRYPVQFNFDKQHGYTIFKGVYYRMIRNLQLSDGSQDLQYIHFFLMDPEFGLTDNIMPHMMGNLSQMTRLSKGEPDTPNLTESITRPYNHAFIQHIIHYIKELEQHGTLTIVSRKSVNGSHILPTSWAFKVKRFPDGRLWKFEAIFCARGDRQV